MLAHTLHEHARLLDPSAASAALAEARAIAADCGMTRLLAVLDQAGTAPQTRPSSPCGTKTISGSSASRTPSPGYRTAWACATWTCSSASPAGTWPPWTWSSSRPRPARPAAAAEDGLHDASGTGADEILDQQARAAYRQRLTALDEELTEAEAWHDTERASRLRAEKDFLVRELAAATGLGGRPRRLGAESERARLNVTRAIRSAIAKIRDRAPAAAAHLDQSVRTGTRCSTPRRRLKPSYPPAIARCALALITAIVSASCSLGLNWTNSVPASAAGTCPGVM